MESIKTEKTEKELQEMKKQNKDIADNYAKAKKGTNATIKDITNEAVELYNNEKTQRLALQMMQETVQDLAQLILYQEIIDANLSEVYDLVDRTNDGYIANGNAKEYIASLITGVSTYNGDKFIPNKKILPKLEKYLIQIYDSNKTLNPKAYQYMKEITLQQNDWLPYFLSGKLNEYMNTLREQMYKTYKIYRSNLLFDLITKTTPAKTITGTATNMFDSLVLEVLPAIEKMMQFNAEYNLVKSKQLYKPSIDNIVILMSTKNASLIKNGIKTQLFNANLLGVNGKTLTPENIVALGNKITMTDGETEIVDTGTEWIDDNTIIVLDISRVKSVLQVNYNGIQEYPENMTTLLVNHIWGAIDILPWCKFIKYTNANLSKLPN